MKSGSELIEIESDVGCHILASYFAKALGVCVFVLLVGMFADITDSTILIVGAILSVVILWFYTAEVAKTALSGEVVRTRSKSIIAFSALVPWAFSAYLFFYRGLWHLVDIFNGFSWVIIGETFVFVLMGYLLINAIHPMSELARKVTEKTLRFKK